MELPDFDVIIIGGGIVGVAVALALSKQGLKIKVLEKAISINPIGAAIGLFPNGLAALKEISPTAWNRVDQTSIHVDKMVFKNLKSEITREVDTKDSRAVTPLYLVWYLLQQYMKDEVPESVLSLGNQFMSYNIDEINHRIKVTVLDRVSGLEATNSCKILIGADGINSSVRQQMCNNTILKKFHDKMMFRAVFDMTNDKSVLYPRGTAVNYAGDLEGKLFAVRETSPGIGTVTSMANFNESEAVLFHDVNEKKNRWKELFSNYPTEVIQIIDDTPASALHVDRVDTIDVLPEWSNGAVLLIGDAAHAMTPGMGQGVNMGLEDAVELAWFLKPFRGNIKTATITEVSEVLTKFWTSRIDRVKEVHAMSEVASNATKQANYAAASKESDTTNNTHPVNRLPTLNEEERQRFYTNVYTWKPTITTSAPSTTVDVDGAATVN